MKKRIATLLAAAVLGTTSVSAAAPNNPFADVPASHWAYKAVSDLSRAGLVDGYGDGTFRGDKTISRYEMAVIVARIMSKADKANAEQKATIEKLENEFAGELDKLGVRVKNLENKVDNLKFDGTILARYQNRSVGKWHEENEGWSGYRYGGYDEGETKLNVKLRAHYQVNDEWAAHTESEVNKLFREGSSEDSSFNVNHAWIEGPLGKMHMSLGKFDVKESVDGRERAFDPMFWDIDIMGARLEFGNKIKTKVFYGKGKESQSNIPGLDSGTPTYTAIRFDTSWNQCKAGLMFHDVKPQIDGAYETNLKNSWGKTRAKAVEFNFGTPVKLPFPGNWYTWTDVIKSNASDKNKAFHLGLSYNDPPDTKTPGTWGMWTMYHYEQAYSAVNPFGEAKDWEMTWSQPGGNVGFKGFEIGLNYVPVKNSRIMVREIIGEPVDKTFIRNGKVLDDSKAFRLDWEWYF